MLTSAAIQEFPNGSRSTTVRRATHAIKAHMIGNARQDLSVGMLAQQHRQIAMPAQVQWDENVFVPEDVDPLPTNAQRGIDGSVIEHAAIVERAHPGANSFGSSKAAQLHERRGQPPLTFFLPSHRCASLLLVALVQSGHSPEKTSSAGPVMNT